MPDHVDPAPSLKETVDNADNSASSATNSPFSTMEEALGPQEGGDGGIRRSRRVPVTVLWAVAVVVIVVDQITKQWALAALADGRHTALLGRALGLVLVRNPGAAFSFATGQTWIFAFLVVIIIIRVSRNLVSRSWAVALGLVLGGAVGNLIDRLLREPGFLRGHVIDFIDYGGYFVGNVADIAIVLAAAGIIILSLGGWEIDGTRAGSRQSPSESQRSSKSAASARTSGSTGRRRRNTAADSPTSSVPAAPVEPE